MNKYYFPLLLIIALIFVSCSEDSTAETEPEKKKVNTITQVGSVNNSEDLTSDEGVVDPDEFSNAFSDNVYDNNKNDKEEFVEDKNQFFKEGRLVQNKFTNQEFIENQIAASSLASQIISDKRYSWLPNWDYTGTGSVRLPDAAISSDKSLLAIIDNVSSQKGRNSSLIVVLNTFNFKIQAIYYYKGKLFTGIKFLPSSTKVILWEKKQDDNGKGCFNLADLRNGRISASSVLINSAESNFAVTNDAKELIVKISGKSKKLFIFPLSDLSKMPKVIECDQETGKIAVSEDNKFFALAGKGKIEIFKLSDKMKLREIITDLETVPEDFIFVGDDNIFALLSYMNPLYLVTKDSPPKKLCELAGRKLFFRKDINSLIFEESKNKAISIVEMKSLKQVDSFSPEKLKPRTYGTALLLTYLPHLHKYMVLDRKGNLSLFYRPGRRWRKSLIFATAK